ncbi:F-box protein At1g67340 [Zea mays]|uniref:F-box protein n=1 Tax=Zea mays TaxID=4577 RepID=K7V273_MAIZE|nr:F-box protein At1g67340 [Zea mays]AQK98590.1 F-box protein [Zea mays]|eukprot:XP_008656929.1 F-box protein At1g67340 [Zea mays]
MRTRSGSRYSNGGGEDALVGQKRKRAASAVAGECACCERRKRPADGPDYLDALPDDLVLSILTKVAADSSAPADLLSVHLTCKRLNELGSHDMVFAKASPASLSVKAAAWSEAAQRFLKRSADAGNLEACYILGMIRFYCLGSRSGGAALLAKAAVGGHAAALYSLAVIQFNGSGGAKSDRDLRAGAALCARAAALGHVDALRELGHCLQDGYGVRRDPAEGRRLLVSANARELTLALSAAASRHAAGVVVGGGGGGGCPLLSDFGWSLPEAEPHAANQFMVDWWWASDRCAAQAGGKITGESGVDGDGAELRLCSHVRCGRRETRRHEFRRCSVCGAANYCSRACQALDWKRAHKVQCVPVDRWLLGAVGDAQDQQQQQPQ